MTHDNRIYPGFLLHIYLDVFVWLCIDFQGWVLTIISPPKTGWIHMDARNTQTMHPTYRCVLDVIFGELFSLG